MENLISLLRSEFSNLIKEGRMKIYQIPDPDLGEEEELLFITTDLPMDYAIIRRCETVLGDMYLIVMARWFWYDSLLLTKRAFWPEEVIDLLREFFVGEGSPETPKKLSDIVEEYKVDVFSFSGKEGKIERIAEEELLGRIHNLAQPSSDGTAFGRLTVYNLKKDMPKAFEEFEKRGYTTRWFAFFKRQRENGEWYGIVVPLTKRVSTLLMRLSLP